MEQHITLIASSRSEYSGRPERIVIRPVIAVYVVAAVFKFNSITLDRIHDVIQIAMCRTDSHLHEFSIGSNDIPNILNSKKTGRGAACTELEVIKILSMVSEGVRGDTNSSTKRR